jgi:hypothetical protein
MYIGLHAQYRYCRQIFNKTRIFSTGFTTNYSNIKFHENRSRFVPCEQTGKHDEYNSRLSLFCERAENCDSWSLHHKDNLNFVIIIIIIIIIIYKFKLCLNTVASHVGILSILPKTSCQPTNLSVTYKRDVIAC